MSTMEYSTHYSDTKDKVTNINGKIISSETYKKVLNLKRVPKRYVKSMEKYIHNQNNKLDFNNLVSQSSQVVCLAEKGVQLSNDSSKLQSSSCNFIEFSQILNLVEHKKLNIEKNSLKSFPKGVEELQNLKFLNLSHNQLVELPDSLGSLKNLEVLDLSHNELSNLPFSCSKLQRLKSLNISNNIFKTIPKCIINGMGTLTVLNISQNSEIQMNFIPYSKYIEKFYATNNGNCYKFPDWILMPKFFNLKDINLNLTKFDIYSFVGRETNLSIRSFSMTCSNLSSSVLKILIENMVNLEKINVGNQDDYSVNCENIFNNLPIQALKNPATITELNFSATYISTIPSAINKLRNLKKLDLGSNSIFWLPEEICDLKNLKYLKLDGNGLIMLPENIGNLESLEEIYLQKNSLVRLPETFKNLKNLKYIDFYDNRYEEFPDVFSEMLYLQGLDLEKNFFTTDSIQIGEKSYSMLRNSYLIKINVNLKSSSNIRKTGVKIRQSDKSDNFDRISYSSNCNSCEEDNISTYKSDNFDEINYNSNCNSCDEDNIGTYKCENNKFEENWDNTTDSDDEFDPNDSETQNFKGKSKNYIYQKPQGFCPEDMHLKKVKTEVTWMSAYGSLQTFKIEKGQFDDV